MAVFCGVSKPSTESSPVSAAAVVAAFASFLCPPGSFSSRVLVPLWEFRLGEPRGGWLIRGWVSPMPLPVSDMEIMWAQELCCDPAQPLDTNRNNWVARPGLARGVTARTKGTGNRHTASSAPAQPQLWLQLSAWPYGSSMCCLIQLSVWEIFFFWNWNNAGKWLAWG